MVRRRRCRHDSNPFFLCSRRNRSRGPQGPQNILPAPPFPSAPAPPPPPPRLSRGGEMDSLEEDNTPRHDSWSKFEQWRAAQGARLLLFTTKGATDYRDFRYQTPDILLFGRESAGVTDAVVEAADARLVIPITPGLRSLNVAMTAAMAAGEALRQIRNPPG